jgi:hypothetical protein
MRAHNTGSLLATRQRLLFFAYFVISTIIIWNQHSTNSQKDDQISDLQAEVKSLQSFVRQAPVQITQSQRYSNVCICFLYYGNFSAQYVAEYIASCCLNTLPLTLLSPIFPCYSTAHVLVGIPSLPISSATKKIIFPEEVKRVWLDVGAHKEAMMTRPALLVRRHIVCTSAVQPPHTHIQLRFFFRNMKILLSLLLSQCTTCGHSLRCTTDTIACMQFLLRFLRIKDLQSFAELRLTCVHH